MLTRQHGVTIELWRGDITRLTLDAIVNAANPGLRGGGGVDGAIHRAAGPGLLQACLALGFCPAGQVRVTPGFLLPARLVLHTVGPVWRGGDEGEAEVLASCYRHCLDEAAARGVRSIAFPAISCGVHHYPALAAMSVAWQAITQWLAAAPAHELQRIVLVASDDAVWQAGCRVMPGIS
jgi:O-acetyl-ADP-ribose deacetylase (regulator of RNase III)